jgi:hypothetical protein
VNKSVIPQIAEGFRMARKLEERRGRMIGKKLGF